MSNENIRCIVKCVQNFQDGNLKPSSVKKGEVLDLSEDEYHKFQKSGPEHFELIDRKFLFPKKKPEVTEMLDDELVEADHVLDSPAADWKPVGWYAAQLAREPADDAS
jgi:hypothetical protein